MNKPSYTPGPWIAASSRKLATGEEFLAVWQNGPQPGETGHPVCIVSPEEKRDEQDDANARLIAAAPEMAEALRSIWAGVPDTRRISLTNARNQDLILLRNQDSILLHLPILMGSLRKLEAVLQKAGLL